MVSSKRSAPFVNSVFVGKLSIQVFQNSDAWHSVDKNGMHSLAKRNSARVPEEEVAKTMKISKSESRYTLPWLVVRAVVLSACMF